MNTTQFAHINNNITTEQWQKILSAVEESRKTNNEPPNALYSTIRPLHEKTRHSVYDNYDRFYMPALDFIVEGEQKTGRLYVYNSSEMARAPISLDQGLAIARNFFNEYGGQISEEIVCEYVDSLLPEVRF